MRIVESNINKKIKSKVRSKEMILVAIIMGIFLFILFTESKKVILCLI